MSELKPCGRCGKSISVNAKNCPHCSRFNACILCGKLIYDDPERKPPFSIDLLLPFFFIHASTWGGTHIFIEVSNKVSKKEPLNEDEKRAVNRGLEAIAHSFHDRCLGDFLNRKAQMQTSVKCRTCGKELKRDSFVSYERGKWE